MKLTKLKITRIISAAGCRSEAEFNTTIYSKHNKGTIKVCWTLNDLLRLKNAVDNSNNLKVDLFNAIISEIKHDTVMTYLLELLHAVKHEISDASNFEAKFDSLEYTVIMFLLSGSNIPSGIPASIVEAYKTYMDVIDSSIVDSVMVKKAVRLAFLDTLIKERVFYSPRKLTQ